MSHPVRKMETKEQLMQRGTEFFAISVLEKFHISYQGS